MKKTELPTEHTRSFHYDHVHLVPSDQIRLHDQPTWELSYVITGEGERTIGDRVEPFRSGEVVLVVPGMPHCWAFRPDKTDRQGMIENITLTFTTGVLDTLAGDFLELSEPIGRLKSQGDSIRFAGATARELAETLLRMSGQAEAARFLSFLQLLVLMADSSDLHVVGHARNESDGERRLRMVDTYVRCHFQHDITIDDISRHVGMNRSAFCVFFKRMTGQTFVAHLNDFRLRHARYLLHTTELSIAEVCYRSGFNDVHHFHRLFKRREGQTPQAFRQSQQ